MEVLENQKGTHSINSTLIGLTAFQIVKILKLIKIIKDQKWFFHGLSVAVHSFINPGLSNCQID